ncbi:MAG: IS30 family transposase, partial [Clostridia bacterium]|nr:IS30 family transposase [Clostridia bacterium]
RIGRTYQDYLDFMEDNDNPSSVQIDTVKGTKTGKVLLSIHFVSCSFMLCYLREENTSKSVTGIFNHLYATLGHDLFAKLFPVILTDNGTEFSNPMEIEFDYETGERRTNVFYCDTRRSDQKGSIEVNHEFIRRISPKGKSFDGRTQQDINLMMSHINSYKRKKLNDKSPYEIFTLMYGKETAELLGIEEIPSDEITLKPSLFKKN